MIARVQEHRCPQLQPDQRYLVYAGGVLGGLSPSGRLRYHRMVRSFAPFKIPAKTVATMAEIARQGVKIDFGPSVRSSIALSYSTHFDLRLFPQKEL